MGLQLRRKATAKIQQIVFLGVAALFVAQPLYSFISSTIADALSTATYTNVPLTGWTPDRTSPSGGYGSESFSGRGTLKMSIDNTKASASSGFYRTEGVQHAIANSDTVKADLYVDDANWITSSKDMRAGIWGVGNDSSGAVSAYPIVEFTTAGGFTGWRLWDSSGDGGWRNLNDVGHNANGWNTLELALNKTDHTKFDVYINGVDVGQSSSDPTDHLSSIILNSYNYTTTADKNYTVHWSNIQSGLYNPETPTDTKFYNGASEIPAGTALNSAYATGKIEYRWNVSGAMDAYRTTITYPDHSTKTAWTSTRNVWIGQTPYGTNGFGQKGDGVYTYSVQARSAVTGLWSDYSAPVSLIYDTTKPTISITTPASNNAIVAGSSSIVVNATDNLGLSRVVTNIYNADGSKLLKSNAPFVTGTSYTLTTSLPGLGLPDGTYSFKTNTLDRAGNMSATLSRTFTIDSTDPVVTITAPDENSFLKGAVNVSGTMTDDHPDHYYFVVVDAKGKVVAGPGVKYANSVADWTWDTTKVADGTYTIQLAARDAAGNRGVASEANRKVVVDNSTLPVVTMGITSSQTPMASTDITLAGTVDKPTGLTKLELYVDGTETADLTKDVDSKGNWSYVLSGGLKQGLHTLKVVATDTYGNVSTDTSSPQSFTSVTVSAYIPPAGRGDVAPLALQNLSQTLPQLVTPSRVVAVVPTTPTPSNQNDQAVLGAKTSNDGSSSNVAAAAPVVTPSENGWKLLGVAWYWWLLVMAIGVGFMWTVSVLKRRRQAA